MRLKVFLYVSVLFGLLVSGGSALAQALTVNGTINSGNPTMPVVSISTPNCTSQGVTPVRYNSIPFFVSASGGYTVSLTSTGNSASFYIYEIAFNPNDGLTNCIAGSNSGTPKTVTEPLTAGVQYFAVPFNDTFDQTLTLDYQVDFSGPGQIVRGTFAATPNPVPTLSEWGMIVMSGLIVLATFVTLRRRNA